MCGICGAIDLKYSKRVNFNVIERMAEKIKYRGPDSQGIFKSSDIALGFTRLAIVGLSNGDQPLSNEDGSIILVCNGEIFNYIELKEELLKSNHLFKTDTDVEVILHLYEEYGVNFLNKLNGQFAFVLINKKARQIVCARDHFGVAPFYYTIVDNIFIFASEIKSILEYPSVEKEIDLTGLDQIFTFPGLISPRTMFKNIYSLENGHCLIINETVVNNVEYWDLVYPKEQEIIYDTNIQNYVDELYDLLEKSISLRLRADVQVAAYLSGGLDSSFIAAMVSRLIKEKKLHTFSIGFEDRKLSEMKYQRLMAEELKTEHHEIIFNSNNIVNRLKQVIYHCECPLKETYNTANFALSEKVNENNIKVVLSGEGSDELFAGYIGYKFDKFRVGKDTFNQASLETQYLQEKLWGDRSYLYERDLAKFIEVKKKIFSKSLVDKYKEIDCCNHFVIDKDKIINRNLIHKRAYIDYKLRLVDHLVCDHGDKMGLGNSVEVRYPFLDKNLFEFVTKLPPNLLLNNYEEKYIIKKCISDKKVLPEAILRREKFEFSSYGSPDLLRGNNTFINDMLDYEKIKEQGVFNPDYIETLKKQYSKKDFKLNLPFENDLLLMVITFGILLEQFEIQKIN